MLIFLIVLPAFVHCEEELPDKILIGSESDYPPFCSINDQGKAEGFSIDLFLASAEAMGLSVEIKTGLWKTLKNDLKEGNIDALPLVGRTPEREPDFDFTFPYISLHGAVFVHYSDNSIKSFNDLATKDIVVMKGDNAEEFVRRQQISTKIHTTDTFLEAFRLLSSKKYDAVITQRVMGLQLLENSGIKNIKALEFPLYGFRQDFCFAVTEGNKQLLEILNEGLAIVISNGTYERIHRKWFTPIKEVSYTLKEKLRLAFWIIIPVLLVFFAILIVLMRREVKRKTSALEKEITGHRQALEQLEESEKKFRSYVDYAPIGIFVCDDKGQYIDVNPAASKLTGFSRQELLHKTVAEMSNRDQKEKLSDSFQKLLNTSNLVIEKEFVKKSGEIRCWRIYAIKLHENRFLGFSIDITENRDTNRELEQSKEKLRHLFQYMNSGFAYHKIILDESGKPCDYLYLETNRAFDDVLGMDHNDIIGKKVTELIPGIRKDPSGWIEKYGHIALSGKSEIFENYSSELKRWFSISAYSPEIGYFVTIFEDITSRKKAEIELDKYRENLEILVKERTKDLRASNRELEKFNKLFVGREFRIKELRDQIKKMKQRISEIET